MKDNINYNDEYIINSNITKFEKNDCEKEYKKKALQKFAEKLEISHKGLDKKELCTAIVKRLRGSRITRENIETKNKLIKEEIIEQKIDVKIQKENIKKSKFLLLYL
tara:strand:- start:105 stop:425 length:321 start_codon:yes stop_codon:yes gene_type:complete